MALIKNTLLCLMVILSAKFGSPTRLASVGIEPIVDICDPSNCTGLEVCTTRFGENVVDSDKCEEDFDYFEAGFFCTLWKKTQGTPKKLRFS